MTNHEMHQLMWAELAITGSSGKKGTLMYQDTRVDNACYACKEAGYIEEEGMDISMECCPVCPIDWSVKEDDRCYCEVDGSPYQFWKAANTEDQRRYWARIIRDLPWHSRNDK